MPINYYQLGLLGVEALEWAFWGYLVFFITYYILAILSGNKFPIYKPLFEYKLEEKNIKIIGYFFLFIYLCYLFIPLLSPLVHISTISLYIYLYLFIVLVNNKIKHLTFWDRLMLYSMLASEYFKRALDGLLAPIALFTLFLVIIDWHSRKEKIAYKITRISILSGFFLFIYLSIAPVKIEFRQIVWYSDKAYSLIDKLNLILELRESHKLNPPLKTNKQKMEENFIWRYSYQASAFSHVLAKTPRDIPFWNGDSYIVFSKFIPRVFWPDKPRENMGYRFGVTYGIISPKNTRTSINTPMLTEMYMNFSYYGIVFGMIILGIIYFVLNSVFNKKNISEFGKIFAIPIIFNLVSHESNFSLVFGNIPLIIIIIYLIQLTLLGRKKNLP